MNASVPAFSSTKKKGSVQHCYESNKNIFGQQGNLYGRGGMIIFYHVAKTGGSTVRSFFQQLSKREPSTFRYKRYLNFQNRKLRADKHAALNGTCVPPGENKNLLVNTIHLFRNLIKTEENNIVYLWEIHGGSPGLDALAPHFKNLRLASCEHNKAFFAFTLLREPLSFTKSYFKFFHVTCRHRWCEHLQFRNATEENMLKSAISHPNQQCFLLKHTSSIAGMHPSFYDKCRTTKNECDAIYDTIKDTFDWVGTTDRLSVDTLPLLQYLVDKRNESVNVQNKKVAKNLPFEESLSNRTIAALLLATDLDEILVKRVRSSYLRTEIFPGMTKGEAKVQPS